MIEHKGDLWAVKADAVVITTNGSVNRYGNAVMGRGCAREAALRYPSLPHMLGSLIAQKGNHVYSFLFVGKNLQRKILTLPVKHRWMEKAELTLIERSISELLERVKPEWTAIAMPRPGCGNGQLRWEDIQPLLLSYLDDRFIVCDYAN